MVTVTSNFESKNTIRFFLDDDKNMDWIGTFPSDEYCRFFVFIDTNVNRIWGEKIFKNLKQHRKEIFTHLVAPAEISKSIEYYPTAINFLEANHCRRFDLVIAIGGGIVIDLVSFTVSTFMRGIPLFIVATTIIGQVDASSAGKTCLNTQNAKNVLGTFYYPLVVYNNIGFLKTNTNYYNRQGFSESFKYGLLGSETLIEKMRSYNHHPNDILLMDILLLTIKIRSEIRRKDALASNLGHTFGHALEKLSGYEILHGDAISVGTVMALSFAKNAKLIDQDELNYIINLMKELHLNIYLDEDLDVDLLIDFMQRDKKSSEKALNLVLIRGIGKPYSDEDFMFYKTTPEIVKTFLFEFLENYEYKIGNCTEFIKNGRLEYH